MAIGLNIPNDVLSPEYRSGLIIILKRFLLRRNDKLRIFLLFISLLLATINLSAQNHITLEKWGTLKHRRFYANDIFIYKTKDTNIWKGGRIDIIYEKSIVVEGEEVRIDKIIKVKANRMGLNYLADGGMIIAGGVFYSLIVLINGLLSHNQPLFTNTNIETGSGLIIFGYLLTTLQTKNYTIGDKWHLKISIDECNQPAIY